MPTRSCCRCTARRKVTPDHPDARVRAYADDVRDMAQRAGLPMPKVTIIESDQPNAFATGRDPAHAAVAATTGLLTMLDRREIRAVMGHELAHVKNRDTLTMTVTATIAGAISALANFAFFFGGNDRERPGGFIGVIAIMILAPMAAALVQMAISRGREYEADAGGAEISGDPAALRLRPAEDRTPMPARDASTSRPNGNPATAHMFIINPLNGHGRQTTCSRPTRAHRTASPPSPKSSADDRQRPTYRRPAQDARRDRGTSRNPASASPAHGADPALNQLKNPSGLVRRSLALSPATQGIRYEIHDCFRASGARRLHARTDARTCRDGRTHLQKPGRLARHKGTDIATIPMTMDLALKSQEVESTTDGAVIDWDVAGNCQDLHRLLGSEGRRAAERPARHRWPHHGRGPLQAVRGRTEGHPLGHGRRRRSVEGRQHRN